MYEISALTEAVVFSRCAFAICVAELEFTNDTTVKNIKMPHDIFFFFLH
jgi:hypothetical protein